MLSTVFLALRFLVTTANPVFIDQCSDGICAVINVTGDVSFVPRASLPACAREGVMVSNGVTCHVPPSGLAAPLLTSDVTL